ncbi:MAG: ATPase AAA-2 domain protein [candidate division TA06 bacterium 32_111]|uniref:ATPase AAA-2 domain protein n=1 Tax=candidate division TA06 bacterium 34_109 TaxID=1635277 RepID=A0A101I3H2_UNCT6|nr:MAG: ATPase AAA-2 domain protein [candidate division TA06 bacterium 32_111]KUK87225.1 MAG: ATPase AAA-2 domain protein [candidate division TA06 bacterium 34_109]
MINFEKFTEGARESISVAQEILRKKKHTELTPLHILRGLLSNEESIVPSIIEDLKIGRRNLIDDVDRELNNLPYVEHGGGYQVYITYDTEQLLDNADRERERMKDEYLGSEHLFLGLFDLSNRVINNIFSRYNITKEKVYDVLQSLRGNQRITSENAEKNYNVLKKYTRDFTELAKQKKLDPVIGREEEVERAIEILSRRTKNNPVLIGEAGVGKTAIVEGLAQKIVDGDVPENLLGRKIVGLDMGALVAGTQFRGEFEQRLKLLVDEVVKSNGKIILFIDEMHNLVGAGRAEGSLDASNMLKPALARGEMQVIGATTIDEYRKYIEKDRALERRFQPILVKEPTVEQTIEILKGLRKKYEEHHKVKITDDALVQAAKLSYRYITERKLPDKAIDLIDEAAARLKLQLFSMPDEIKVLENRLKRIQEDGENAVIRKDYEKAAELKKESDKVAEELKKKKEEWIKKNSLKNEVDGDLVASIVSKWTGIPVSRMVESEKEKLLKMEERLHKRVIGQDEAITQISNAIRRSRAGLSDPKRPIGSFLFVGPTGVGKTEVAKSLAEFLFDSEDALVRIDMSEYMEKFSVSRLVGAPPGYVGYEEGGQLTEVIRKRPFSVVLFDEIEKAHPDVYNILLQVLDDGRLTSGQGRTVDFRKTIIIMTSNIGSNIIDFSDDYETIKQNIMQKIRNHFKPEFINRLDDIIVFKNLTKEEIEKIIDIQIENVKNRAKEFGIDLEVSKETKEKIIEEGYSKEFGARPIKRAIQVLVENRLSEMIISGKVKKDQKIVI